MAVILTDEGQDDQLSRLFNEVATDLRVGLFTSRTGTGKAVVLANINAANFSGYAVQTPAFAAIADSSNGRTRFQATDITFTHNGGGTGNSIAGWYMFNNNTGKLYFYEDYSAPVSLSSNGQFVTLQPIWFYGDLTPPL